MDLHNIIIPLYEAESGPPRPCVVGANGHRLPRALPLSGPPATLRRGSQWSRATGSMSQAKASVAFMCQPMTIRSTGTSPMVAGERRGAVAHQPPFPRPPITSTTSSGASLQKQIPSSKDSFKIFVLLDLVNFSYLAVQSLEKSPTSAPCRCTPSLRLALGKNRLRPSIRLRFSEHSLNSPEFGRASFGVM